MQENLCYLIIAELGYKKMENRYSMSQWEALTVQKAVDLL